MRTKIKEIIHSKDQGISLVGKKLVVKGWVRTVRNQKAFTFIELNDGSTLANLQVIIEADAPNYDAVASQLSTGASVSITGVVVESPGKNQKVELKAATLDIIGQCDPLTYPLQKKRHSFEFLRSIAHLRPRTNTQGALSRVRNALAFATHNFFQERGFLYVHTPIITGADCEGAGKMFRVTTLDEKEPPLTPEGEVDFKKDFFERPTYLTVSGQLNGEIYALALSDIYTFGPTFRAENSNTFRHLAEFWMIEPEMAFADLNDNMDCAEAYLKYTLNYLLDHCAEDMAFFEQFIEKGLIARLENVLHSPFARITYTEAIQLLQKSMQTFEFPVEWGCDLQSEHERYLAEQVFKKPVILTNYPKGIKAFYMREDEGGKTVSAMDVLVPKIGELMGGSQREERLDYLERKMDEARLPREDYWWYLELRKYGGAPHSGFGAGFERLVLFATGMENIRDVIPFPRYPGHADF